MHQSNQTNRFSIKSLPKFLFIFSFGSVDSNLKIDYFDDLRNDAAFPVLCTEYIDFYIEQLRALLCFVHRSGAK